MANDFKVGDRIRLVHEGVVSDEPGYASVRIDGTWRILGKGETVEVLEREVEAGKVYSYSGETFYISAPGDRTVAVYLEGGNVVTKTYDRPVSVFVGPGLKPYGPPAE